MRIYAWLLQKGWSNKRKMLLYNVSQATGKYVIKKRTM